MAITVFKYKTVKGPLHKVPAALKLFLFLPISIFCMSLAPAYMAFGIASAAAAAFLCGFSFREQLADLKPAAFYAALMYALSVFSSLFSSLDVGALIPRADFLRAALRLVMIVQLSSLLFRTTSSMEIRDCLRLIELFIKRAFQPIFKKRASPRFGFAENISLFLSFIPEIFQTWTAINTAWKARAGKNGVSKIKTTLFILITLSFEKAAVKSKALAARSIFYDDK